MKLAVSVREREVADLVAEGLSNPQIARRLYLSRPTVASHIAHILNKLAFSSRVQIAAWVVEQRFEHEPDAGRVNSSQMAGRRHVQSAGSALPRRSPASVPGSVASASVHRASAPSKRWQ